MNRHPALIATAIALPVTVLLALLLTTGKSSQDTPQAQSTASAGPLTIAPPQVDAATAAGCAKIFAKLPVTLAGLAPRKVANTADVYAWGNPAVVLRCGVSRPAGLVSGSDAQVFDVGEVAPSLSSVEWFHVSTKNSVVWTSIDRAVYVEVTVPISLGGADVMPALSSAVAALPAICEAYPNPAPATFTPAEQAKLCVYRR